MKTLRIRKNIKEQNKKDVPYYLEEEDDIDDDEYIDEEEDGEDIDIDEEEDDKIYKEEKKRKREENKLKSNPIYKKICKKITDEEPDIKKIICDDLLIEDRVQLFQLYEIYLTMDHNTEQWLEFRNKYIKLYNESKKRNEQSKKYNLEEQKKIEEELIDCSTFNMQEDLKYKILQLNTSKINKQIIFDRYQTWKQLDKDNEEYIKLKQWLHWSIEIPHNNIKYLALNNSNLSQFLFKVKNKLDKELYGMENVKEQLLLFISSKILNPNMKKCSLGLVGPSGTGKTRIARLMAELLDFPFEQISLGGITSPDMLKGHAYTYIGAQPGEIVKCLKRMKYKNGILFMDEYEKVSTEKNLCASLLHITDPSQNMEFRDNYLSDIIIDLSSIWFIYSMNSLPEDTALRDRIYAIYVPGYNLEDKICITNNYLLPKALENIHKDKKSIIFVNKNTCQKFIKLYEDCKNPPGGVRHLEKTYN